MNKPQHYQILYHERISVPVPVPDPELEPEPEAELVLVPVPVPKKIWTELPLTIRPINDQDVKEKYSNCNRSDKNTFPQVSELHEIYLGTEKDDVFTLTHQLILNNDIVNHADKLYICTK